MGRLQDCAWRYVPGMHPGMERLIKRADGEHSPALEAHLMRCAPCRENAESLRRAVCAARDGERGAGGHTAPLLQELFSNLQLQMRAWYSLDELLPQRQSHERVLRRSGISKAVEFYFGKEIARRLQSCTRWDEADHTSTAITAPLFKAFLGRRAAEAVASRIAGATT